MELLVTGGNGFIGRRLCKCAVRDGHEVSSVARSGPPEPSERGRWATGVDWIEGDVFAPQEWREALDGVDCVIHSIGTLSESPAEGVTFERINGDSAIITALESERADVDRFVYISSSTTPPLVSDRYLTARRRAEAAIRDLDMETVVPRFGPVYGPAQPHFPPIVNRLVAVIGRFELVAAQMGEDRPFSVEQAAAATYRLAVDDQVPSNPVRANELAALAN
jgi:uncharacterized protein YbjT (DUF2867 family)